MPPNTSDVMTYTAPPKVSKKSASYTQLTYELPHRVHCSQFYPISAEPSCKEDKSNPSIIVYGHDQGITVVWKGFPIQDGQMDEEAHTGAEENNRGKGKGLRKRAPSTHVEDPNKRRRRRVDSDAMVEDDENDRLFKLPRPVQAQATKPDQPSVPVPALHQVTHMRTVHLGTAVHALSFPPSTILSASSPTFSTSTQPSATQTEDENTPLSTVLLQSNIVAAAACADYSIRVIQLPLLPGNSHEPHILTLAGLSGHRTRPTSLALTLVPSQTISRPSARRQGHRRNDSSSTYAGPSYDLLLASASSEVSGLLLLWRITLQRETKRKVSFVRPSGPRTVPLSFPATHVTFNPSSSSSLSRHNLLVADINGGIRILDTDKGRWLISFYMDYPTHGHVRKRILGVDWCLDGQAIVAFGGDGEWGVFELLGRGKYTACGRVGERLDGSVAGRRLGPGGTIFSGSSTASSSTGGGGGGSRSIVSATFSNPAHPRSQVTKGGLAVTILPASKSNLFAEILPKAISGDHEMLVLAYENQFLLVPSIQESLASRKRGNGERPRYIELKDVVLGGEDVTNLSIRWLLANKVDSTHVKKGESDKNDGPESERGDRRNEVGDDDADNDDDEEYFGNQNGSLPVGIKPFGADKYSPRIQVAFGAGHRLNVLEIEDESLGTSVAAKPSAMTKTGLSMSLVLAGNGLNTESFPANWASGYVPSSSPGASGPFKRKAA